MKRRSMIGKMLPTVRVLWIDASQMHHHVQMTPQDFAKQKPFCGIQMETVGWLMGRTAGFHRLATDRAEDGTYRGFYDIPSSCVLQCKQLR